MMLGLVLCDLAGCSEPADRELPEMGQPSSTLEEAIPP